jgi:hypothetical protein
VPLDAEDEVGVAFGSLTAFYGFDDGVLGAAGGDAEAVSGDADGLMMAGVDRKTEEIVLFGGFFGGFSGEDVPEDGFGGYGRGVGDGYGASGGVVDGHGGEVLDEGSSAPDVEGLHAEADGEDGLVEVVGVLNEKLVDVFAGVVGGGALGDGVLPVLVGVDVGGAAGKEDGLAGVNEIDNIGWGAGEGDLDGIASGTADGFGIGGPGALIVVGVGAGGKGDGYARLHRDDDSWGVVSCQFSVVSCQLSVLGFCSQGRL